MIVLDQVKRSDPRLRWIGAGVLLGLLILLSGLWHVQVVSRHKYQDSLRVQSFRNVRLPATRGKIFDRNGNVLAQNQPRFVVNLYLEELRNHFRYEYTNNVRKEFVAREQRKPKGSESRVLEELARYRVVSNIVWQVSSAILPQPLILNPQVFARHYRGSLAMPLPVITDLTPDQVARFMEKMADIPGVELELETYRSYPHGQLAAHTIGYVQKERGLKETEEEFMWRYRLPDYEGMTGVENGFDQDLRGKPGGKAILVNNIGYRSKEEVWLPPTPGRNVTLTLDLEIQKAAERALAMSGKETRGAAVVLDVRTGDVLAMASSPAYDLNMFVRGRDYSEEDWARLQDEKLLVQYNRALQGTYHPGSIFKMVVALAAFEHGVMTPEETIYNPGYYQIGRRKIRDNNAPIAGSYAFKDAFKRSANTYFIEAGLRLGHDRILEMGHRLGLGEKTGVVPAKFESRNYLPPVGTKVKNDGSRWMDGDTANLSIGQGEVTMTPMQAALMTAAIANGGKLLKPRLVLQVQDQENPELCETLPAGQVERHIGVSERTLDLVRRAMLADVEEEHGTGRPAYIAGMGISGKTGTAQVRTSKGMDQTTWFVSFAPFEYPKYAVVVMVESGSSGGSTCAPKAKEIYRTIQRLEQQRIEQNRRRTLAVN